MRRTIAVLTIAAAAVLGLSACSDSRPSPAASAAAGTSTQTAAEACTLVQQAITDATTQLESATSSDPAAIVDSMTSASQKLAAAAPSITNDQVAPLVPALQDMFTKVSDVMGAVAKGDVSKAGDLSQLSTQFDETSAKFQAVCGS
ncbi:hypothetical protein [Microbacterium rhizomatis]|uniref:Lipoprotein n=1 Tax=Microbacterium rhizomatis TaxID=1631477 RepID=A0A5J5J5L7_9MICO|nr:hypothetical protein [Microbacterium rhizomatis]KAA9111340.1 hypothetical protein F6B43_07070 [Microbacterium rhizomatis]